MQTRKNAIVEYLDYGIPVTQLKGSKGNGDMQAAKRDWSAPPTGGRQISALWAWEWAWLILLGQSIGIDENNRFLLKFLF